MPRRHSGVLGGNRRRVSGIVTAAPTVIRQFFPSTNGPAAVTSFAGNYIVGIAFTVSTIVSLQSFWLWTPANGDVTPVKTGLWQASGSQVGHLVAGSVFTSGALTQGAWNPVAVSPHLALTPGATYVAEVGWVATNGFPFTANQFGAAEPFAAGIVGTGATAYSDVGGSNPTPPAFALDQCPFSTASADPSAMYVFSTFESFNGWVDISVG